MSEAFNSVFNTLFVDTIPTFLMSEPVIYIVATGLLVLAIGLFHKLIK